MNKKIENAFKGRTAHSNTESGGKYHHLFFDLDHTLWDFEANAHDTLSEIYGSLGLKNRGVEDFNQFYKNYLEHNEKLWERYRNGYIGQAEMRVKRMSLTLLDFKIADEVLAGEMSAQFLEILPTRTLLFPDAIEVLTYLRGKNYELHLITNGFEKTQHSKLKHSGLDSFFREVITSESSNSLKPKKEIFDYALQKTQASKEESIMIGDSIEVDILGAKNAGIDQVFVNHLNISFKIKPTYTIRSLKEMENIF